MHRSVQQFIRPIALARTWGILHKQNLHTTGKLTSSIYELRNYQTCQKDFKALIQLYNDHVDKRTKYSKLLGFWTVEIGDNLWQLVHLWEYGSLEERRNVRNALAKDEAWAEFLSLAAPRLGVMRSQLVVPAPSTKLNLTFTNNPNATYVLQTIKNAKPEASLPKPVTQDETLVGRFITLLGPGETEYRLWRYLCLDSVTQECLNRAGENPTKGSSVLLYPAAFSPIK